VHARFQDAAGNWSAGYVDTVLVNTSGTQPSSLSTTYAAGWNMVSLPVLPEDRQVSALFPDAVSAFAFAEGYAQISELQVCTGYWVNLEQGGTYTWAGAPCTECARSLPSGWSMLGVPYGGSAAATIQQTPASSVLAIFGFAGQYRQVGSPTGELWPGAGYWVNLAQPGLLVVSGGTAGASWPGGPVPEPVGPALWVESAGSRQPISLGVGPEGVVALPPPPPAGAFDARVIVDGVGAWSVPAGQTAAVYALQVQGAVQRLAWTVPTEMRGQWSLQVGTEQVELAGTGSVAHAPGVSLWLHRHGARPAAFAVGPNHPNPFNASTTIGFQLPQAARVTLSVYDLAGQSVRALHLGEKGPGRHWVEWDGRGDDGLEVATGVYLYEVRAGGLRAVRRMLVLR